MAGPCRKVPRVSLPVSLEHERLTSYEDYICTTVHDLFSTPPETRFVDYKALDINIDNKEHLGAKIVESYPLSAIDPPSPNPAHIHEDLDKMDLSAVQKDAVRLAASRFQQPFLESGMRRGFLVGDGPGAGKTRIVLATLYNEIKNGNDRHILLSLSNHLYKDIVAEFETIAPADWVRTHMQSALNITKTADLSNFKGILFMTYRRFRKSGKSQNESRLRGTEKPAKNPKMDGGLEDNATRPVSSEVRKLSGMEIIEQFLIHEDGFSGVIALDDSHVGKNALHNISNLRSKVGQKIVDLLKTYQNAKVVYCTATPASNSNHFGILSSLGIWGPDQCFKDFDKFYNSMSKWEPSAAELVSLKLKKEGAMVCRQISYEGVEVSSEFVASTKEPELYQETYNEFAEMWREMLKDVKKILTYCKEVTCAKIATFFSAMIKFFRAYIIHSKIGHLVEMTKREHDLGNAVVIGIHSTGESSYKTHPGNWEKDYLISNTKEIMENFVKQHFCIPFEKKPRKKETRKRKHENDSGKNVASPDVDVSSSTEASTMDESSESEEEDEEFDVCVPRMPSFSEPTSGNSNTENTRNHEVVENQDSAENLQANRNPPAAEYKRVKYPGVDFDCKDIKEVNDIRRYWLRKIEILKTAPPNFLDEVQRRLSNLGIKVAEITGRKLFLEKNADNDKSGIAVGTTYHIKDRQPEIDLERIKFMSDEVQVAIISDAGSFGISLHSSNECQNKRKRVHITVEMGWSAEMLYHQLGRTNRTNQKNQPEYKFLLSNVHAEIRFTSVILGHLSTMSAFSCAQRSTPICDQLAEQAQYNSNAGIKGIKAAWAYFCDQETTIPYEMIIFNKSKVVEQLKSLGLKEYMEKTRSYGGQGRTLKQVVLTRIMNKLLGCSLDVQESFCKVWNFFMMHYKTIDNKPRGVVVIPRSKCVALFNVNGTVMLVKRQNQVSDDNRDDDSVSNSDANNDLNAHGPINLVPVKVYLGSTMRAVVNLHQAADVNDKVSGFYVDNGKSAHQRYFYLQNITPELTEIGRGITQSNLNKEATICILHQPHQPPIDMNMDQVLEFKQKMYMFPGLIRTELWDGQADDLMHQCIHRRCLHDCPSRNCPIGRRMGVKYLVEGDVWAIWEDIVATLKDEDPVVAVIEGHDYDAKAANVEDRLKPNTRFGIVIPNGSSMELKHRVLGDFICP